MTNRKNISTYINCDNNEACAQCGDLVTAATDRNAPCVKCVAHDVKRAKHIADMSVMAAKLSVELVSIERTEVKKGFQFVGTFADGQTLTIRAVATRPYTMAAIHDYPVVSKFRHSDDNVDVRGFVTFHNAKPKPSYSSDRIIKVIPITAIDAATPPVSKSETAVADQIIALCEAEDKKINWISEGGAA